MPSILLVDDNEDLRDLYAETLRRAGYSVCEAEDGEQALALLESLESGPCLLLLDLMMPVMSGPELLKILHDNGRLESLPVVVLSAAGQASQVLEARAFMKKPVDPRALVTLVRRFCAPDAPA